MTRRKRPRFNRGLAVARRPASLASFGRRPYRRGGGPRTAPPVTGRLRSPPYPAAAPASTTTKPSASRWIRQSPEECHRHGSGTPRIVRVSSSSLNGASHPRCARTRLRRAVDPGDLCQPSGPDGEGQAEGQAPRARGETSVSRPGICPEAPPRSGHDSHAPCLAASFVTRG